MIYYPLKGDAPDHQAKRINIALRVFSRNFNKERNILLNY